MLCTDQFGTSTFPWVYCYSIAAWEIDHGPSIKSNTIHTDSTTPSLLHTANPYTHVPQNWIKKNIELIYFTFGYCEEYTPQDTFSGMGRVFFTRGFLRSEESTPPTQVLSDNYSFGSPSGISQKKLGNCMALSKNCTAL